MNRQIIFDEFRSIIGRGLTQAEVDRLDNAITLAMADAPVPLKPSKRIEEFIKGFEQLRLKAYMPTPNDVPTIGWGSTGADIKMGMVWTEAQADARFAKDLADFAKAVSDKLGTAPTTQDQFDAMVSLAYNIGKGAFAESTLLRLHKEGNYAGAAAQFGRWNKQKGVELKGLTRRRAAEERIYRGLA